MRASPGGGAGCARTLRTTAFSRTDGTTAPYASNSPIGAPSNRYSYRDAAARPNSAPETANHRGVTVDLARRADAAAPASAAPVTHMFSVVDAYGHANDAVAEPIATTITTDHPSPPRRASHAVAVTSAAPIAGPASIVTPSGARSGGGNCAAVAGSCAPNSRATA